MLRAAIVGCGKIADSHETQIQSRNHDILIKLRGRKFKSYADKFIPPALFAKQCLGNLATYVKLLLARDFHVDSGTRHLIEPFYRSIHEGASVLIPYRKILLTARIMDAILDQLSADWLPAD